MKNPFVFLLITFLFFSCAKEEKDDSYKCLYNKFEKIIYYNRLELVDIYNHGLNKYEKYPNEIKNCNEHYEKVNVILKRLDKLDFSNHKRVYQFKDSIKESIKFHFADINESDRLSLNDSVFKKITQYQIISGLKSYLIMNILKPTAFKISDTEIK